jgi:hypothetical protein
LSRRAIPSLAAAIVAFTSEFDPQPFHNGCGRARYFSAGFVPISVDLRIANTSGAIEHR